jgi:GSCFA family protein
VSHPYRRAPHYTKWRSSMSNVPRSEVDPVISFPFRIRQKDKVATAGSCFAQHIARSLVASGFNFFIAEPPHIVVSNVEEEFGYRTFSARYGNIYTSRQLLQLAQRAFGQFVPEEEIWVTPEGTFVDPFRPTVQPGGFVSLSELAIDRAQHLSFVRNMLHELDFLVFTLGLTELWYRASDGAAYPICPGVVGGEFDPELHRFVNLDVDDVVEDMSAFFALLKGVNPRAKMILTVSPVALAATAEDRHVVVSTTYSKAVLRVAAERLARLHADIAYFPSFEIILGQHSRGEYLAEDLREVNASGVAHVMRLFAQHATEQDAERQPEPLDNAPGDRDRELLVAVERLLKAECDEAMLGQIDGEHSGATASR